MKDGWYLNDTVGYHFQYTHKVKKKDNNSSMTKS